MLRNRKDKNRPTGKQLLFLIPKLTHVSTGNNRFYLGDDSHRITPTIG